MGSDFMPAESVIGGYEEAEEGSSAHSDDNEVVLVNDEEVVAVEEEEVKAEVIGSDSSAQELVVEDQIHKEEHPEEDQ